MKEKDRVDMASDWYLTEQLDFDKRLIGFRYKTIRPYFYGVDALELGPAEGQMTQFLVDDFKRLTVVEGSLALLDSIPDHKSLEKVHSLFENYCPDRLFDTIIMEHILEHVEEPVALLERVKRWASPDGVIILGVPNGNSFHRLAAVKMGLLKHSCELNKRDLDQGHRRVYTPETFRSDVEASGLRVKEIGGVFFKPISNKQIQEHWTEDMMHGFYELGRDFPEHAADIYAVCKVK